VDFIAANPDAGKEIRDSGDARKVRFAGEGKSGGYRVIAFYRDEDVPMFLLNAFAKNEKTPVSLNRRSGSRIQKTGL
jgi:hypothetical protein